MHDDKFYRELCQLIENNWLVDVYIEHKVDTDVETMPFIDFREDNGSGINVADLSGYGLDKNAMDVIDLDRNELDYDGVNKGLNGSNGDRDVRVNDDVM